MLAVGPRLALANAPLQALLDARDQQALQDHIRFVMSRSPTVDARLELPSGCRVRLRGIRVQAGTMIAGMVGLVSAADRAPTIGSTSSLAGASEAAGTVESRAGHGHVASWRAAAATVEEAMRCAAPVLVLGEPGTGRLTLLAKVCRMIERTSRIVVLGVDEVEAAPAQAAARLWQMPATPALLVLRDADRLSSPALTSIADALAVALSCRPPRALVAATASEALAGSGTHQRLLALFHACATVPALRYRRADLPALVDDLLIDLAPRRHVALSPNAWRLVYGYDWPGNIRQLKQALAAALARRPVGVIQAGDLPAYCQSAPRTALRLVDETERDTIVATLREVDGNRMAAAAALGLARSTLYRKIRQYGIMA